MTVVVDASLHRGGDGLPVLVIPRGVTRGPLRRRGAWRDVRADDAVSVLAQAPPSALVLTRAPEADPGAVQVARAARAVGRTALVLPEPADIALSVCALAVAWCADRVPRHAEAVAALVSSATDAGGEVLGLPPRILARWAARAWLPCTGCGTAGGGVPGRPCARCGTRLPPAATPLAPVVPLRRSA